MERIPEGTSLSRILEWCEAQDASDLHVQSDQPFCIRVHGQLQRVPTDVFPPMTELEIYSMLVDCFTPEPFRAIKSQREADLSFYHGGIRYRANFSKERGQQSFSFRTVPQQHLKLDDLQLPTSLHDILENPRGVVLVTGPTGQGKSTTLRALIQEINETQALRIITIEDPIEYVFDPCQSQIEQREVGIDTDNFADGIRNAMRQDPDIIFVGEIRDRASTHATLQAAETGHLVLTTLHADSTAQAIGRVREFYPANEQENIGGLLARNLKSVLCQRLLPNVDGTRTPCFEIMRSDAGVRKAIRSNNLELLTGIIEAAVDQGMHTFDQYLQELLAAGVITEETARYYATNRHKLDLALRGIQTHTPILIRDH